MKINNTIKEIAGFGEPIWDVEDYIRFKEENKREDGTK